MQPQATGRVAGWVRRWLAGLQFRQIWQLVTLAVLAATAPFGGLDSVDTGLTVVKPGEKFSDGQFTVTVKRATLATEVLAGEKVLMPARRLDGQFSAGGGSQD